MECVHIKHILDKSKERLKAPSKIVKMFDFIHAKNIPVKNGDDSFIWVIIYPEAEHTAIQFIIGMFLVHIIEFHVLMTVFIFFLRIALYFIRISSCQSYWNIDIEFIVIRIWSQGTCHTALWVNISCSCKVTVPESDHMFKSIIGFIVSVCCENSLISLASIY